MQVDLPQLIANAAAAAVGTLVAGFIGVYFGIQRFRRERAFDRRLAWHEAAVISLTRAAERLFEAIQCESDPDLEPMRDSAWKAAYAAMPGIQLELEGEMYASRDSYEAIRQAREDQRTLISPVMKKLIEAAAGQADVAAKQQSLQMLEVAAKTLVHAASLLATDVRNMLGLNNVGREKRLYDSDHRKRFAGKREFSERFLGLRPPPDSRS